MAEKKATNTAKTKTKAGSTKSTRAAGDKKNLLIGFVCAVAAVAVIAVIVALVTAVSGSKYNDKYFESDDTKLALTIETGEEGKDFEEDEDEYVPAKVHMVWYYDGDTITSLKTFYEYGDTASAKQAYEFLKNLKEESEAEGEDLSDEVKDIEISEKYVIVTSGEAQYADMTVEDVRSQIEFMEALQNVDLLEESEEVDE